VGRQDDGGIVVILNPPAVPRPGLCKGRVLMISLDDLHVILNPSEARGKNLLQMRSFVPPKAGRRDSRHSELAKGG